MKTSPPRDDTAIWLISQYIPSVPSSSILKAFTQCADQKPGEAKPLQEQEATADFSLFLMV